MYFGSKWIMNQRRFLNYLKCPGKEVFWVFLMLNLISNWDWHSGAKHHWTLIPPTKCGERKKSIKSNHPLLIHCHINAHGDSCPVQCCAGQQRKLELNLWRPQESADWVKMESKRASGVLRELSVPCMPPAPFIQGKTVQSREGPSMRAWQAGSFSLSSGICCSKSIICWNIYLDKQNRLSVN